MAWNLSHGGSNVTANREDEVRFRRQLEALNSDEEYKNHPSFLLMRHDNSEDPSGWNGNQSEERQPQIEGNQVSFRRFHDCSQSRGHPINRSHGHHSRSPSPFRRAPVHSDRRLVHNNHAGRANNDHLGRLHPGHVRRAHNNRTWRSRSLEERYRGQRERFRRIQTSPESDPEIDRTSTIREQSEYLLDQEQHRNELINLNGGLIEEGYGSDQSDKSSDSLWRPEVDAEFLNGRYTTIKTIPRHPKGVRLSFNIGALNNQTNLSLHTRFTIMRTLRRARLNSMNNGQGRQED
ncbi:uncharacterized protein LOC103164445 [Cricetulus griseus]|uniref:uncharacterized protein LOC103164445 n=1 Tax=Cricetulus griseus TaxID=10029 RepID=UPI0015C3879D|nr:uncharacterized protein LOC103164445 [Cricetulus griseus]